MKKHLALLLITIAVTAVISVTATFNQTVIANGQPSLAVDIQCEADSLILSLSGDNWPNERAAYYLNDALLTAVSAQSSTLSAQWIISPIPTTISGITVETDTFRAFVPYSGGCDQIFEAHTAYLPLITSATHGSAALAVPAIQENGAVLIDDFAFQSVMENVHRWDVNLNAGEMITASLAVAPMLNAVLTAETPDGELIGHDFSEDGAYETVTFTAVTTGLHHFYINAPTLASGDYILNVQSDASLPQLSMREGTFNSTINDTLLADQDHFWGFYALAGEIISFTVDPDQPDADTFLSLIGQDGYLANADEDVGVTEEILDFVVEKDGLYLLQVAEWDFAEISYTLVSQRE